MFTSSHYMVIWSKIYVIIRIPNLLQYVFIFNSFNLIFYLLNDHDDVWTEDDCMHKTLTSYQKQVYCCIEGFVIFVELIYPHPSPLRILN